MKKLIIILFLLSGCGSARLYEKSEITGETVRLELSSAKIVWNTDSKYCYVNVDFTNGDFGFVDVPDEWCKKHMDIK